jgi:hypothetical protein
MPKCSPFIVICRYFDGIRTVCIAKMASLNFQNLTEAPFWVCYDNWHINCILMDWNIPRSDRRMFDYVTGMLYMEIALQITLNNDLLFYYVFDYSHVLNCRRTSPNSFHCFGTCSISSAPSEWTTIVQTTVSQTFSHGGTPKIIFHVIKYLYFQKQHDWKQCCILFILLQHISACYRLSSCRLTGHIKEKITSGQVLFFVEVRNNVCIKVITPKNWITLKYA